MRILSGIILLTMLVANGNLFAQTSQVTNMVKIPEGIFQSFFKEENQKEPPEIKINSFYLDEHAVTNLQFLDFVKANPKWQKSKAPKIFSDNQYLSHWKNDLEIGNPALENSPVTNISWFAAEAYAKWVGKRLPTMYEWEYASNGKPSRSLTNHSAQELIDNWYRYPNPKITPNVKSTYINEYGLYDIHGLIWEWVHDFNNLFSGGGDSRGSGIANNQLYCAAGSLNATDKTDYVSFMRYGFRESLKARYSISSLGFRCAKDIE